MKRASLSQTLKDAIDRDDTSAVRNLCAEMLAYPINETGFLLRAVKRKSFGAALVLLELLGSDEINHMAKDGRTVLHEAVETVHVVFLDKILSTDIDVNAEDPHHRIPLSIALEHGHFDAARLLWSASDGKPKMSKSRPNKAAWRKGFIKASSGGYDDIVPWILSTLVELFRPESSYLSVAISQALVRAASKDHETTVQIILDTGRALNLEKDYSRRLKEASRKGIEAIKLLEQPEIDGKGKTKGNALANAAQQDDSATVLRLLRNGADINYKSGLARTALQAAAEHGRLSMVHLLLDKGADINAQVGYLGNALQAASLRGYKDVVEVLLSNGADVNTQGGEYGNALQAAIHGGYKDVVEILLSSGADVNTQVGHLGNALQAASIKGHKDVMEILLNNGADVNTQGGEYGNALQAASYKGFKDVIEILLNNGADVNTQGGEYGNALQAASHGGHKDVMEILLNNGAEVNAQGGRYGNALKAAQQRRHPRIVEMLQQLGAKDVSVRGGS